MRTLSSLLVAALALAWPITALAAFPADVTNVTAALNGANINISWSAPADNDIAYYRIYYSRSSILENNGEWEDFVATDDAATSFVVTDYPAADKLYFSVLAVNEAGEETPYFTDEASVTLKASSTQSSKAAIASSSSAVSSSKPLNANSFGILSAQAISSTGVLLTFSNTVVLSSAQAREAFEISDGSGITLNLHRLILDGEHVMIDTETQEPQKTYIVLVKSVVHGKSADNKSLTLDPKQNTVSFVGASQVLSGSSSSSSLQKSSSSSSSAESSSPEAALPERVQKLIVRAQETSLSMFTVEVEWQNPEHTENITGLQVEQSRDRGVNFSDPQTIPLGTDGVRFRGVPSGNFGVAIRTVAKDGSVSDRVFGSVVLPAAPLAAKVSAGRPSTPPSTPLPKSGPGLVLAVVLAGGIMGWRKSKKGQGVLQTQRTV